MALTNAERQAAFKARKAETIEALTQQNSALLAEVAELRAELDRMREKAHRLEVSQLKAQLKAKAPEKAEAEKKGGDENDQEKVNACRMSARHFPAGRGPFAGALTALCLLRDDFLKGEAHTAPAAQVLRQAGEVLAVLLAHPAGAVSRSVSLYVVPAGCGSMCCSSTFAAMSRVHLAAPHLHRERLENVSLASLAGRT